MKTVGILGGMGSMATVDLFSKIIKHTQVTCDQDHLHIIIDNYAEIPDRTHYILHKEHNPLYKMIEAAKRLESAGADILLMPCNTAHFFYEDLEKEIGIPIIHMMRETKKAVEGSLMLFATEGTYAADLYKGVLYPDKEIQTKITELIYDYKQHGKINDKTKASILKQITHVDGIILGCTELPLIFNQEDTCIPLIDPTEILARKAVKSAGAKLKEAT
ncbi:MAG: amino acid racemase [Clostridiales bacterium]|nr:amino acid racemase [Clostridiales bacterium]